MIRLTKKIPGASASYDATLSLPVDVRVRSRAKVRLDDGREAGLFLARGSLLRGGDRLSDENGLIIKVLAAKEAVSTVYCDNTLQLTKAAYHLGNRHVPLQINHAWLRYQRDSVLDEMLLQMGYEVRQEFAGFEPEAGAYHQHKHNVHAR
ncbi:MAG TPA: urease accessory protein UreE [Gammaproteobacteria bacterium]|nr:urease accessory protein UreE [Gammaproteobacteria bacterium]